MSFCCILIIYWFISYYVVLILYNYINVMYWLFSCSVFSLCLYIYIISYVIILPLNYFSLVSLVLSNCPTYFSLLPFFSRKACCQRWNHQLFVYIHCLLSIYYMILCFLLSMHKPFLLEIQTGLLWARKRQCVSLNTLHYLKPYWPFAVHTQAFSSGTRA